MAGDDLAARLGLKLPACAARNGPTFLGRALVRSEALRVFVAGDFRRGGLAQHGEVVGSRPTWASQRLNGSAFGLGMDWMIRKAASVLTQSVL